MMHTYLPFVPHKEDSAFYLLGESMIEYLTVCLSNDKKSANVIFKEKMKSSKRKGYAKTSLFSLSDNGIDATTQKGSAVVIYEKAPAVIHKFAQKIGGNKKLLELLSVFYRQVEITGEIDFTAFEKSLKSQETSNKQWQWFVKKL